MDGKIDSATHWWSTALRDYAAMYNSLLESDTTSLSLPRISQQQVEAFRVSLRQQLVEATHAGTDWSRPTVLFVNSEHACPELTTAAEAADIESVHRILPEETMMRIYPDEVMVTRGNQTSPETLEIVWSAHEVEAMSSALKQLVSLLGLPERVLRQMVNTKQLKLYHKQGRLRFRCNNLEGILPESSRTARG
jgi:hypothetical protein